MVRMSGMSSPYSRERGVKIGIKRDLLDDALVPLYTDLDQNNGPTVAQRGRHLDADQAA